MNILMTILGVVLLLAAIFLVIAVLMQSSRSHKLSGTIAGGAETFFGKTKGATIDKKLNTLTAVVAVIFVVIVAVMYIIQPNTNTDVALGDNVIVDDSGNVIIGSDAIESDAVESDAVESDAVESDAVESDAVESDAVESDAVESDAVESAETDEIVGE